MKKKYNISSRAIFKASEEAALKAGVLLKKYFKNFRQLKVQSKKNEGVVSEADQKAEEVIRKTLTSHFSDHKFIGEEMAFKNGLKKEEFKSFAQNNTYTWMVDPLDGTTNFLNGFSYYSICISLLEDAKPVSGYVYRPETGESWKAFKGIGSFYREGNMKPWKRYLMPRNTKKLKDSVFITGFAMEKDGDEDGEFKHLEKVMQNSRAIRRLGSAALDMCYTSQGIFDGYWERGLSPWDVAASSVICTEAGLDVVDYFGGRFDPFSKSVLTASKPLSKKLLKMINSIK